MDSWWRRVVQCFIDEVMDCEINNYVVRDMTTTDTYSSDLDWMARGISQPRGHPVLGSVILTTVKSFLTVALMSLLCRPSGWIRGMVMLLTAECA